MPPSKPPRADRDLREGDIMVTAVGSHFAIGRLNADCTNQEHLETHPDRAAALTRACALAGGDHRVFLSAVTGVTIYRLFKCPESAP